MDQEKIGKFIAESRKNKKMTNVFKNQFLKEIQEDGKEVNINFDDFCKIIKKWKNIFFIDNNV